MNLVDRFMSVAVVGLREATEKAASIQMEIVSQNKEETKCEDETFTNSLFKFFSSYANRIEGVADFELSVPVFLPLCLDHRWLRLGLPTCSKADYIWRLSFFLGMEVTKKGINQFMFSWEF